MSAAGQAARGARSRLGEHAQREGGADQRARHRPTCWRRWSSSYCDSEFVRARPGQTLWDVAMAPRSEIPHLSTRSCTARRQLSRLHGRSRGRTHARRFVLPQRRRRHEGAHRQRTRRGRAQAGARVADQRRRRNDRCLHEGFRTERVGARSRRRSGALPLRARAYAERDVTHPAIAVNLRAPLHPMHALPARVPRRAGQRRDRPRAEGAGRREDQLRRLCPLGDTKLRRLRRVRAGLPDRCADAGARCGPGRHQQNGRFGVPVLRCQLYVTMHVGLAQAARSASISSAAATARRTTAGSESRAATASTTCTTPAG